MGFSDRFIGSLSSTDLRDDQFHHSTDALQASALADKVARNIGSLMLRVKYFDTLSHHFEDYSGNLATLMREWLLIVTEKGAARKWIRTDDVAKIGQLAPLLYKRVSEASLAHYLDGKCACCHGSGISEQKLCVDCKGSGEADLPPMSHYEHKLVRDMVGELLALETSHSGVATALLRREV